MSSASLMILPILAPLALAVFVLPWVRKSPKACAALLLVSVVVSGLAFWAASGSTPKLVQPWVEAFTLNFSLNGWKSFVLGFMFLFQLMTAIYALGAIGRMPRPVLFVIALLIACSSSCLVILTDSLLVLLIGWELFLLALYAMIHSGGEAAEPAARKALIIGGASDFLMILGIMLFCALAHGPDMAARLPVASTPAAFWAFCLIFLGAGAKAGMFPFHTWIPDAAQVMPAAGFAAMPASLEKILGIYFLFILTNQMFVLDAKARIVMYVFGLATVFVAIIPALTEKDLRKVLALTAISPAGFMVCGMAVSEAAAFAGALLYMMTHATYKSAMFLAVGNFEDQAGGSSLERLTGIARRLPWSGAAFLMALVAAISLPPTGGFMAKELLFEGFLARGHFFVLVLLAIGAVLNVSVFAKVFGVLWAPAPGLKAEGASLRTIPALLLGVCALMSGMIFQMYASLLGEVAGAHEAGLLSKVWHYSPLTLVSLGICTLGFLLYAVARAGGVQPAAAFDGMTISPVLGPAVRITADRKFDAYDLGLRAVDFLTRIVFRYVERMIDVTANAIIAAGRGVAQPVLNGAHNGMYGNYLSWVVMGFMVVLFFMFAASPGGLTGTP